MPDSRQRCSKAHDNVQCGFGFQSLPSPLSSLKKNVSVMFPLGCFAECIEIQIQILVLTTPCNMHCSAGSRKMSITDQYFNHLSFPIFSQKN